jgi:ribose 5-phosphate isomerase B
MLKISSIALGADHAGYPLKEALKAYIAQKGINILDEGTHSTDPVNYPPYIRKACEHVLKEGIPAVIFGGSGQGEAIAANKMPGIRAARCLSVEDAVLARSHNDANVLSLAGRMTDEATARQIVDAFLNTPFEGGRHTARVKDIEPGGKVPFFGEVRSTN